MAKRIVKWSMDGSVLKLAKALADSKAVAVIEAEFDLAKLYPTFAEMTEVQKHVIAYGVRQNLMDTGAGAISDPDGKVTSAKKKWQNLLDGKITSERINATSSAENKRIASAVKEAAKEVSLQGLMYKKLAFPATFTPEDEEKLQEFLAVVAKSATGKKGGK